MKSTKPQVDWVARSILTTGSYYEPLWWRVPGPAEDAELFVQSHTQFDGVGWFAHLLHDRYGVTLDRLPVMPGAKPPPPLWRLILPALRCAKAVWLQSSAARWKHFVPTETLPSGENPPCRAWIVLTNEETERVQNIALRRKVSLNALGIWAMNRALRESLIPNSGPMLWSVPVNMRGSVSLEDPSANHVSGVEACTPIDAAVSAVHQSLLTAFRNDEHWVAWHMLTLGKWFGEFGSVIFKWTALPKSRRLTGSFSYLGCWPPPSVELIRPDYAWCCTSIARLERPLGVGMINWKGKLSIGLIAHPSVSQDPKQAEHWLSEWKLHVLDLYRHEDSA